jgi:riboflavin transporter FmnP
MLIEFPLPFAPSFYKLDFSEVAVLMGGFAMGPWAAVVIEALKILLLIFIQRNNHNGSR